MRKLVAYIGAWFALGMSIAAAEELPFPPAAFVTTPAPYLDWSGIYVGINAGYGWGDSSVNYSPNDPAAMAGTCGGVGRGTCLISTDFLRGGPVAGGQIGFNWQPSALWLVGLEADYQWSGMSATADSPPFRLGNVGTARAVADQSVGSFGTLRARMGAIVAQSLLLYGTAGLAIGQVSEQVTIPNAFAGTGVTAGGFSYLCTAGGPACFAGSSSRTQFGWSGGAGAEYALTTHLTLKAELLYVDLGPARISAAAPSTVPGTTPASFAAAFPAVNFAIVRGGFNLRF